MGHRCADRTRRIITAARSDNAAKEISSIALFAIDCLEMMEINARQKVAREERFEAFRLTL